LILSLEVAKLGNSAGRIDGRSRRGLPVRASSSKEDDDEKDGVTVRMDAVGRHSCVASHVTFGIACTKAAHDKRSEHRMEVLASIFVETVRDNCFYAPFFTGF
jgi:hypothetical protein